jgi:hypothetical protein
MLINTDKYKRQKEKEAWLKMPAADREGAPAAWKDPQRSALQLLLRRRRLSLEEMQLQMIDMDEPADMANAERQVRKKQLEIDQCELDLETFDEREKQRELVRQQVSM